VKRVLLLKPGVTSSKALLGDYELWFRHATGGLAHFTPVELHAGEVPPGLTGFDAVVMTGSPLSVTQPTPWMERAADLMLEGAERGLPVLGVCFGHQLLAWRLGATVSKNPLGRELGTVEVRLTPQGAADPLFHGLPARAAVQATHEDLTALPEGATLLATNDFCAVQAFAHGPRLRGVQFHPEMDAASIRYAIRAAGAPGDEAAQDTPWGALLLTNFVTRF